MLRTNLTETDPVKLWEYHLKLARVEEAFRTLKSDLAIRPIYPPAARMRRWRERCTCSRPG